VKKDKNVRRLIDRLLRLFRDMKPTEIDRIMKIFKENEKLRLEGYGWKGVTIKCVKCDWRGRRIWGEGMFDKKCPKCDSSVSCPIRVVRE